MHAAGVAEVFQNFIDEELPLAVRVPGVYDERGLLEQFPDRCKLLLNAFIVLGQELPVLGINRKIFKTPDFGSFFRTRDVVRQIRVRFRLLE